MSNNEEVSLKVGAKVDIAELVAWTKAVNDANAAMTAFAATSAQMGQATGGGGIVPAIGGGGTGGANAGAPPPTPTPPAPSGTQGAPPAPPGATPGTPAPGAAGNPPPLPPLVPRQYVIGPAPGTGGANTGAAPPTPTPPAATSATPSTPAAPGAAAPAAPATPSGPARGPDGRFLPSGGGSGGGSGSSSGGGGWLGTGASMAARGLSSAGSFLSNTASSAIGFGLGSSLFGLPMSSINRYLQLSTVMTQLDRKFRDSADSAQWFGQSIGYGTARSAALAEQLGKVTNRIDQGAATGMVGFARFTGADASTTLQTIGRAGELSGKSATDLDLARILLAAKGQGMDGGRLEEFLSRVETSIQTAFAATGRVSIGSALQTTSLPSLVYGANDPRRANDDSLVGGLHSTMTSGGAMRSYMMRAMGYGQSGGPSYVEMKKRLDAGVYDQRNVSDLFGSFQARGMGEGAQFRALESVAGGSLKAHQIEALVKSLGTKEGLERFRNAGSGSDYDTFESLRGTMSESDFEAFSGGGFAEVGKRHVSEGETYEGQIEARMLALGGELAQGIPGLMGTMDSLGRSLEKLVGNDIGGKIMTITGALERVALAMEKRQGETNLYNMMREEYETGGVGGAAKLGLRTVAADVLFPLAAALPPVHYDAGGGGENR